MAKIGGEIMQIKHTSELTPEQIEHMHKVHKLHVACNGTERQKGMDIVKAWVDNDIVCVRLSNGEWYHYYSDETWG
jgi:hypothetical protein